MAIPLLLWEIFWFKVGDRLWRVAYPETRLWVVGPNDRGKPVSCFSRQKDTRNPLIAVFLGMCPKNGTCYYSQCKLRSPGNRIDWINFRMDFLSKRAFDTHPVKIYGGRFVLGGTASFVERKRDALHYGQSTCRFNFVCERESCTQKIPKTKLRK